MYREPGKSSFESFFDSLRHAGLRPTSQRLMLANLIWGSGCNRHICAEDLLQESRHNGLKISLATVYNTLHQFTEAGLLKEISVESGKSYFDTNLKPHSHFLFEDSGEIMDIEDGYAAVSNLPPVPHGAVVSDIQVVVRLKLSQA